ncbi:hypothetical protein ACQY0O_005833 [Thecaphora frezii]
MDQQAFRQLLSAPRAPSSSSSSSSPTTGSAPRAFGLQNKRSHPTTTSASPSDLKPRKVASDKPSHASKPKPKINPLTGEAYIDRASARRMGKESEYAEVEKLMADFEARAAQLETEEERQSLMEQVKYLGGDEKHTVLVKGLDFALLAQNKARLEAQGQAMGDDELERAFESAKSVSTTGSEGFDDGEQKTGTKRTRETIIEALKKRKLRQSSDAAAQSTSEPAKFSSKFKPIGFRPIGAASSSSAPTNDPDVKYINGKRMRKKKKRYETTKADAGPSTAQQPEQTTDVASKSRPIPSPPAPTASTSSRPSSVRSSSDKTPKQAPAVRPAATTTSAESGSAATSEATTFSKSRSDAPAPPNVGTEQQFAANSSTVKAPSSAAAEPQDDVDDDVDDDADDDVDDDGDDDIDIFAEAGSWKGLSDDDSDTDAPSNPRTTTTSHRETALYRPPKSGEKRDWFAASLASSASQQEEVNLPSDLRYLVAQASRSDTTSPPRPHPTRSDGGEREMEEGGQEVVRSMRLEGFSDSALPSDLTRLLLEREKEREEKAKLRQEGGWRKKRKGGKSGGKADEQGREHEEQDGEETEEGTTQSPKEIKRW